jgi:cytochrome c-type biogenesis protein
MTPLDLATWAETAVGGSMALALPVALLAGLVSFFSPCVVPLLPGYLSYATGLGAAEVVEVFVITGVVAGSAGRLLAQYREVITRVLGVLIIVLGLIFAGVLRIGQRDLRIHRVPAVGVAAAPLVGVVFALGWTPCLSPTLGVVVNLGFNEGTAVRGGLLGFVYALGLGIPFVLAGLAFTKMASAVAFLRERQQLIMRIGGVLMIVVGVLLASGIWNTLTAVLRQWAASFETVL